MSNFGVSQSSARASRRAQPALGPQFASRSEHGGALGRGKRKRERPLDPKRPLHVVMRASGARGPRSMLAQANVKRVDSLVRRYARRFQVRVLSYANVGNHLHLLVQGASRPGLQSFLRVLPGQIAQMITGAVKGQGLKTRFWDLPVFSRVVEWGRALETARRYLAKNDFESAGLATRAEIDHFFRV